MLGLGRKKKRSGGAFTFRVSDVVQVPLRGTMLRLRRTEGTPSMDDLAPGAVLRVRSPEGEERRVAIVAHSVTAGRATQERLDRVGELDVIIEEEETGTGSPIELGWTASGPVE